MARMYSRKTGKSCSTKPIKKTKPVWVSYKPKEVESLVLKLAKAENTSSKIGLILRDTYGIPDVKAVTKKKIAQILKEKGLYPKLPEDLTALIKKFIYLSKHKESNNHDMVAKRGLQLTESKIKRLVKYYKARKVLPKNWRFEKSKAKLLVE
ncbi:MAG: 30S ribosomal protein S15 [Nanoarchaeota archaeon]|nr:30S ribosomal protein S15 [Nanoarchaeota archaeon]